MKTLVRLQIPSMSSQFRSVFAAFALLFGSFLLVAQTASAAPLNCSGPTTISMTPNPGTQSGTGWTDSPHKPSTDMRTCDLPANLQAIYIDGMLNSTMTRARGFVQIEWLNASSTVLSTLRPHPQTRWVGRVVDERIDLAVPVPANAVRARIMLATQSRSDPTVVGGTWSVSGLSVSEGVVVNRASSAPKVAKSSESAIWTLTTTPDNATGNFTVSLTDIHGQSAGTWAVPKTAASSVNITFPKLAVSYYEVAVKFAPSDGKASNTNQWTFVSLPDAVIAPDPRIGIDSAAGIGGTTPQNVFPESLELMKAAGVGSIRERISLNERWGLFNDCTNLNFNVPAGAPPVNTQAAQIAAAGLDAVTAIDNSPPCMRPGLAEADGRHPLDYDAVHRFGQAYANGIGRNIRSVEYWNEPNLAGFWRGYPWQYASALKAFSAGVKSVDPNIRVLLASSSTSKIEPFFYEVHENNAAGHVDLLNYHYYGGGRIWGVGNYNLEGHLANDPLLASTTNDLTQYPRWMTETGFPISRDDASGAIQPTKIAQANYLVKTLTGALGAGYDRAFYFLWSGAYMESDQYLWGITEADSVSPRPAYLSLALLAQHLQDATPVKVQTRNQSSPNGTIRVWTVFFQKSGQYVAISWAGRDAISNLGAATIRDVFGKIITNTNDLAEDDSAVYLLSGITSLPTSNVMDVPQRTRPMMTAPAPLMLQVTHLYVDDVEIRSMADTGNNGNIYLPLAWGQNIEIRLRARNGNNHDVAGAQIECLETLGLILLSPTKPTSASGEYTCRYRSQITDQHDFIYIKARAGTNEDTVRVALSSTNNDPNAVWVDLLRNSTGQCRQWLSSGGVNISVGGPTVSVNSSTCAIDIEASVMQPYTWYAAKTTPSAGEMVGTARVRAEIVPIPSRAELPQNSVHFQMLYDNNSTACDITLIREGTSNFYSGLWSNAASLRGDLRCDLSRVDNLLLVPSQQNLSIGDYGTRITSLQFSKNATMPPPLNVSTALSADSIIITNNTALGGKLHGVALPADAPAPSVNAIESTPNAMTVTIAAGIGKTASVSIASLPAGNYTFYFFVETEGTRPYTTWTPLQTLSFTVADDGSGNGNGNGNGQGTALFDADIQKAYIAFFNRPADAPGMAFWMNHPPGGMQVLLAEFARSEEYLSDYRGLNHVDTLTKVYRHLFGRDPEPEGLNYWSAQMEAGWVTIANVAYEVLGGARNEDFDIIVNKVLAANAFTGALDTTEKIEAYNNAGPNGLGNEAKNWLAAVNEYTATVEAAVAKLGALLNTLVTGN